MVHELEVVPLGADRLARIATEDFDPSRTALVERAVNVEAAADAPDRVELRQPRPDQLEIELLASSAGLLVVADTFHKEFRATLDGQPVEILRVNHAFRGIRIPEGAHLVEMRYVPDSFRIGMAVSGAALCVLLAGMWHAYRSGKPALSAVAD
jgi:uncharacterized membrane protein YfhO